MGVNADLRVTAASWFLLWAGKLCAFREMRIVQVQTPPSLPLTAEGSLPSSGEPASVLLAAAEGSWGLWFIRVESISKR